MDARQTALGRIKQRRRNVNTLVLFLMMFIGLLTGVALSMIVYTREWMSEQDRIKELKQSNDHLKDMITRMEVERHFKDVCFEED